MGEGWNIDSVEIVRKITTSETGYGYQDGVDANGVSGYTLSINGQSYSLLVDTNKPWLYYTQQEQGDFLYVERHNEPLEALKESLGVADTNYQPSANTTGEWWEVVTKDGMRYRLGWNSTKDNPDNSEQLALMYGYSCTTGNPCTTPDGAYASLGYAGHAQNLVAMRWRVDQVEDAYGNTMTYTYDKPDHPASALIPQFDLDSYLQSITYTGSVNGDTPGYQVQFKTGARDGDSTPPAYNLWDNYDTQQLNEIDVCYGTCSSGTVVRKYNLTYGTDNFPDTNGTLILKKIDISGGGYNDFWGFYSKYGQSHYYLYL